ncbi:hypothetical protein EHQ59_11740 [Leptospira kemamanensis]|uniref:NHL repeat protein n=1 Tax=Leptospira kemamanensis TaxID=2484942 RepID=A0A4R9JNK4_9LEPT|nr:NHL repeat-containing protein [Leptospira kemamanensis]TGL51554.1 hypothetical protein EHQ59_11740 [Leptospira kemamanensis]
MEIIVYQKLKWILSNFLLTFFLVLTIGCKPKDLNNLCDSKSDAFVPTLIAQTLTASGSYHCGYKLLNVPPFGYRYSTYRLYLNFPVSILPIHRTDSSYAIQGELPTGLSFDTATGEIKGTTAALASPRNLTITRNSPGFGIVNITLQVVDTNPTFVYGQFGSFTCGATYNDGTCTNSTNPTNQNLSSPYGVTSDSFGGVYIAGLNRILYYHPNTNVSSLVYGQYGNFNCDIANVIPGSCSIDSITAGGFSSLRGIAIDKDNGLYATDLGNQRVLYYPYLSPTPTRVYGQTSFTTTGTGTSETQFSSPRAVTLAPDGGLFVADANNIRVLYFPPGSTTATRVYGQDNFSTIQVGPSQTRFNGPFGMAADSEGGLYVADSPNNRVLYFPVGSTTASRVYGQINFTNANIGSLSNNLNNPTWIALDQSENLYVSDSTNNRVVVFPKSNQSTGHTAVAVFGQYNNLSCAATNNVGGCTGGSVNALGLFTPSSISFNQQGQLYINDQGNNRILVY